MTSRFLSVALVLLIVLMGLLVGERYARLALFTRDEPQPVAPRADLGAPERLAVEIFEQASPSVVHVFADPGGGLGGLLSGARRPISSGSGFVWDEAGHVVTNHHVVAGSRRIGVRFASGETVMADLVGQAPDYDLAVLRVDGASTALRPLAIGESADLQVGQAAFAIGNPFGLGQTLTTGVVSALNRRLPTAGAREIPGVIQTDAAINPGNSGGPLLDSAGRLIGVNTAILSETGAFAGIGFAVPVDLVNWVVPQMIREGHASRPTIGILAAGEEVAPRVGVRGVIVVEVLPGSPAARAGLRGVNPDTGALGDVIVAVEGQPVESVAEMVGVFSRVGVGGVAELRVLRGGEERTVRVQLVEGAS